jgi:hypothetical protein
MTLSPSHAPHRNRTRTLRVHSFARSELWLTPNGIMAISSDNKGRSQWQPELLKTHINVGSPSGRTATPDIGARARESNYGKARLAVNCRVEQRYLGNPGEEVAGSL